MATDFASGIMQDEGAPDTRILFIDYDKCIGCETCESVCKFLYGRPRIVLVRTIAGEMIPLYCRNCKTPSCVKACPKGALSIHDDGRVILEPMRCRGCLTRDCVLACPFGGVYATDEGVGVTKCDLCAGRRKQGELPACMEMCPCGAIHYIDRESIAAMRTDESRLAEKRVLDHLRVPK